MTSLEKTVEIGYNVGSEVIEMPNCEIRFLGRQNVKNYAFAPHKHNCYEVVYFLKGRGVARVGNQDYTVCPHKYCIVPPDVEHVELLEEDGEILFIGFTAESELIADCISLYTDTNIRVLPQLEGILQEYKEQSIGYKMASESFLRLFLVEYLRKSRKDDKACVNLDYIKTYLEQYYGRHISFRELAALTGYSYDYFRHVFKNKYGVSPQDYLINVRLEEAKNMLQSTSLSCAQIAVNCGFSNSAQMTMMIKRKFQKTPMELKKANSYKNTFDS